jgi:ketosteroid isomerase-like protein
VSPYDLLSDDVIVTVNGTTPISGRFPGLAIVKGVLVDTVQERVASARVAVEECVGQGARVAALVTITGVTHQGRAYNEKGEPCGCVFEVRGDRLIETVLFQRQYVPNQRG